jgi:mannosyltransferase
MFWGLFFKHVLRCPLKLVMTSAAIRRHSWFPRQLISGMDAIIATSEQAAGFVDRVVATVPHGVDTRRFLPPEDRPKEFQKLGLPGKYGIGIVGRIRPEKGTDLFVKAMLELLPRHPDFTACIVGRATLEFTGFQQDLARQIRDRGLQDRIVWLGEIDFSRMHEFHRAMSLNIAPARYEGFGLVPLESMACGVPVVASRTGAYPKIVTPGVHGELVPCDDLPALIAAVDTMLSNPLRLQQMGAACRERVEREFSARREAEEILKVYRQLWAEAA